MITGRGRRTLAAVLGGGLCIALVGAIAGWRSHPAGGAVAEAHGGLQVRPDLGAGRQAGASLRCFVEGRFVGEMTIESCAQRNGVSAQGLDVGVAALANATTAEASDPSVGAPDLQAAARSATRVDAASGDEGRTDACLRFANDGWRTVARSLPLAACVHVLYEGRCVQPGDALYGRSGDLTLRLVPGRVESSDDDRRFRVVMTQNDDCTLDG